MDPLSIVTSVLTVLGAAEQISKGISKVHALYRAPTELSLLINEVNDLRAVLSQVASFANQLQDEDFQGPVVGLKTHLNHANNQLMTLDQLVNSELMDGPNGANPKIRRRAWLRLKSRVCSLQGGLRNTRINITTVLGVVTSSAVTRVEMKVLEISSELSCYHAATTALLSELTSPFQNAIVQGTNSRRIYSLQGIEPTSDISALRLSENTLPNHVTQSLAFTAVADRTNADTLQIKTEVQAEGACKRWCSCACHGTQRIRLPRALRDVIGTLFIGYSGLPVLTYPCDERTCRRKSAPSFHLLYYFPIWLVSRLLRVSATLDSMRGLQINLTLPRVVWRYNPLFRFAELDDRDSIQKLFSTRDASPFDVNIDGNSALHFAAWHGHPETCRLLIQQGADMHLQNMSGRKSIESVWYKIFSLQCSAKNRDSMSTIFANEDFLDGLSFSTLHKIVLGLIPRSLEAELDASTVSIDAVDADGKISLAWAAAKGDVVQVKTLLKTGANLEIVDSEGGTALWHAVDASSIECVKLLLEHNADISKRSDTGSTILHLACALSENPTMVKLFLAAGADINATSNDGKTALRKAAQFHRLQNVQYLLHANADPEVVCSLGETVLFTAVRYQADLVLEELLKRRVNHKVTNFHRQGLLHELASNGTRLAMLAVANAQFRDLNPDARDNDNKTCQDCFECRKINDPDLTSAFEALLQSVKPKTGSNGCDHDLGYSSGIGDEQLNEPEFEDALEYLP